MRVKDILPEDFVNYKLPSMFISTCFCDFKCCLEQNLDKGVCQNAPLSQNPNKEIDDKIIYNQFISNPISKAVVIGGMEPMLQLSELLNLIKLFRNNNENCPFVIYTGYYPNEIITQLNILKQYKNIIIKFGRYIPDSQPVYDEVLGITLASSNQYAEVIS